MKKYRVNEIFCSLQGEGRNTGRSAVFVRFSGCNMRCSFCDTDFNAFREMSAVEIAGEVSRYDTRLLILTGGEPSMQVDEPLIETLHSDGWEIAIETNGSLPLPEGIDWITVSPKSEKLIIKKCNEVKCVFTDAETVSDHGVIADFYYLQPCDTGDTARNREITAACVAYINANPRWRLSLQTHKLIGIQ